MAVLTTTPTEACKNLSEDAPCVLIDVRTKSEYANLHAKNAISIPLDEISKQRVQQVSSDIGNTTIYLICQSGMRSAQAANRLMKEGLANVISITGGTLAWKKQNLPIEGAGRKALSLQRQVQLTAGLLALIGGISGYTIHQWFFLVPTLIGLGLTLSGATGSCLMGTLLSKMPWNQTSTTTPA